MTETAGVVDNAITDQWDALSGSEVDLGSSWDTWFNMQQIVAAGSPAYLVWATGRARCSSWKSASDFQSTRVDCELLEDGSPVRSLSLESPSTDYLSFIPSTLFSFMTLPLIYRSEVANPTFTLRAMGVTVTTNFDNVDAFVDQPSLIVFGVKK